ncbi:unnamed protein product, partial [Meganyctiphanes norvegica]
FPVVRNNNSKQGNMYKVVVMLVVVGSALCYPIDGPADLEGYTYPEPHGDYKHSAGVYDFAYAVKDEYTGNDFGHNEASDGSGVVTGKYYVLLPDGRIQTVTYHADHEHGFNAEVSYEGEAQYPAQTYEAPGPAYKAPQAAYKAPEPAYSAPKSAYKAPEVKYAAPEPTYEAPKSVYHAPEPVYHAPAPAYKAPTQKYGGPEPTYEAPDTTYEVPKSTYGEHDSSYMMAASEYKSPEPMDSYRVPPAYGAKLH